MREEYKPRRFSWYGIMEQNWMSDLLYQVLKVYQVCWRGAWALLATAISWSGGSIAVK